MFDWFKEAAIKKGMTNIRNDAEKLIEAANIAESRISPTGYLHALDTVKIRRLQDNLARNIRWAISVEVPPVNITSQIQSVMVRVHASETAINALDEVSRNLFRR
jgi:membrane-associated HD superfamily phosphohydrolase